MIIVHLSGVAASIADTLKKPVKRIISEEMKKTVLFIKFNYSRITTQWRLNQGVILITLFFSFLLFTNAVAAVLKSETSARVKELSVKYEDRFRSLDLWLRQAPEPGKSQAERERILKTIDEPLYIKEAPQFPCVGYYFRSRMSDFMKDFLALEPGEDTIVWKLYNHSEIIQTNKIKIVIDLIKGFDQVEIDDGTLGKLVDNLDVLLITHVHGDHADKRVADMFLDRNKPVVVPELFWPDYPRNDELTVLRNGKLNYPGAKVYVFPSVQKKTANNVYMIMPDNGNRIMHLGDNNNIYNVGHEWFRRFKKPLHIDLLIPNIWSTDLASLLKYVNPDLVMSSHENELGHPPNGRRSYEYVYNVLRTIKRPYVVPAWGEHIVLRHKK